MQDIQAKLSAYRSTRRKQQSQDAVDTDSGSETSKEQVKHSRSTMAEDTSNPVSDGPSPWYLCVLKAILWVLLWGLFIKLQFGVVFLVASALYFMYISMRGSRRKSWEPSAYSVFNKNSEAIEGTLSAEQFERELRFGPTSVKKGEN